MAACTRSLADIPCADVVMLFYTSSLLSMIVAVVPVSGPARCGRKGPVRSASCRAASVPPPAASSPHRTGVRAARQRQRRLPAPAISPALSQNCSLPFLPVVRASNISDKHSTSQTNKEERLLWPLRILCLSVYRNRDSGTRQHKGGQSGNATTDATGNSGCLAGRPCALPEADYSSGR